MTGLIFTGTWRNVAAEEDLPPPMEPLPAGKAFGWTNAIRLQNEQVEAIIAPDVGRLVWFSLRGQDSPLRLDPALQGQRPPDNERFFNVGGDWLWPVAQARWPLLNPDGRNWPPPAVLACRPWTASAWIDSAGAQCAQLSREYGQPLNIVVTRLFRLAPGQRALMVHQRIERTAPSPHPVVLWNISQIARAREIVMPIKRRSRFQKGLKILMGRNPPLSDLIRCRNIRVYRVAAGREIKLGSDSPRGWIAASRDSLIIFESVVNSFAGEFPDGGCVVEVYSNDGLGYSEIETFSPEAYLAPGMVLKNTLRIEIAVQDPPASGCALANAVRRLAGE